ncbi:adhesion G protein-coupled receptor L3-like isoform X2 [Acropora millepora]|uniref:adhesion G protein-coupled receptor L3-like isoform X2 n=1 Tax=Acropora millepora TaxID=45264 RepID=UPI001CF33DA0|nr:adhesion G protein-coupled receptor L3-like isoform X2 [Acropora millepora]
MTVIKRGEIQPVHSGFFKVFFNRSLNALFVLANIRARGDIECALVCLRIKVCLSFNFAIVPDANQYTCQLLPTDKYRDPYRFALSEQFHHYAMPALSPCETVSCEYPGQICNPLYERNDYKCVGAEEIIVCEHGPSKGIRCEKGGKIIVLSANYGRLNIYTCPFGKIGNVTDCRAANSLDKVREMCQNQPSCTLTASNEFFHGDPCPTIQKYLLVEYYCFYY